MLIRTQKERTDLENGIVAALDFSVTKNGKKGFFIVARLEGATLFSESLRCVAIYATKEEASSEIDAMASYFASNPNGIYIMR